MAFDSRPTKRRRCNPDVKPEEFDLTSSLVEKLGKLAIFSDPPKSETTKTAQPKKQETPFRFLDLCGELRNKVYSMATTQEDNNAASLGSIKVPAVARASKQLRQEFLPIFYSDTEFQIPLSAMITSCMDVKFVRLFDNQNKIDEEEFDTPREPASDSLCLEPEVRAFVKKSGENALFRNVTFSVNLVLEERHGGQLVKYDLDHPACEMKLKVDGKIGLKVEICKENLKDWSYDTRSAVADVEVAKEKAESIAAQKGFRGFMLRDLEEIARYFTSVTSHGARP